MTTAELSSDRESLLRRQIGRWRDDLIDLSRRNRLLWFRATGTSTFELLQPDLRTIHNRTMGGGSWGFYLPPDPAEPPQDPLRPAPLPRPDELVTDKKAPAVIRRGLQSLERRTSHTYLDTGLWVLHLGLGMLRWRGPDDPEDAHSPLILVPVTLERPSPREPFQLRRAEGDLVLNPALVVKLQTDFGVSLPAFDDAEDSGIDAVFAGVRSACSQWPDWTIEERAVLATFSFHKEAMYRDLLENEDALVAHRAVRVLGLGPDEAEALGFGPVPEEQLDDALPPERLVSILDADSTQRQCIKAALDSRSFVMDGPPGTGKSQTIANLIAELISRGQTVLFVSEKAAALDVVQNRLTVAGLGEFLLALHSHKATRKEVAIELGRALMTQPMPGARIEDSALSQLRHRRQALTAYVEAMNERREPLRRSLHSAYGRLALLSGLPRVSWWTGSVDDLSIDRFSEILDSARGLSRAWGPVERGDDFLWRDVSFERSNMQLVHEVKGEVEVCTQALSRLRESAVHVASETGLDWTSGPLNASDLADLSQRLAGHADIPAHWLSDPTPDVVRRRLDELQAAWAEVANYAHELEAAVGPEYRRLEPADHVKLEDAVAVAARLPVAWQLPELVTSADIDRAVRLAEQLISEIPRLAEQAPGLLTAFGGSVSQLTLRQVRVLAELGGMVTSPNLPESAWLNPIMLPSLQAAAEVLGTLVEQYRVRRGELAEVFTDHILTLDLETLCPRFEQVYRGPFAILRRQFWADRRLVASATRLGRVDRQVRANLRNALEWQRLSSQLTQAERQHAGVIGGRYYQREQTDLSSLTDAVEHAQRAVQLAGNWIDLGSVARQLAVDGSPDVAVLEVSKDVGVRVARMTTEVEVVIPGTLPALLDAPLLEVLRSSEQVVAPLKVIRTIFGAVAEVAGHDVTLSDARSSLALRLRLAELEEELRESAARDNTLLGSGYGGAASDWSSLRAALEWSVGLNRLTGEVSNDTATRLLSAKISPQLVPSRLQDWHEAVGRLLTRFQTDHAHWLGEVLKSDYDDSAALLDRLSGTTADIDEWLRHVHLRNEFVVAGLDAAIADCARLRVSPGELVDLVERAVLEGWSDKCAQADHRLREVRSQDRDRLVEEFRELDRDLIRKSAALVIEHCNERRPDSTVGQAGIIQAQASLRRRHKPIRRLLTEAGDVARRLKPCFMMSPLSVSSFLPASMRFDVVIFDEASQVRPCDAINCIYRGDRLIVAGDRMQLPPTSFFDTQIADDESTDDDEAEIQDFDSILEQCKGSGFPSLSLQWHYRSQHESLIAFSNASFYDGFLLTFPGAVAQAPDLGVEFFRVGGTYRAKPHNDNPVEAAKVAERVMYYADLNTRREHPLSVGVVTFSDAQEDCVLRAIEDLQVQRPDLDGFFHADRLNGFFVKNLESVQGDERDVMIFSVGYAYDSAGRFALRLGPITAEGGQRRLNVAVTRARRRVEIVASVGAEDFRGEIREGGGVWHLREYLAYVARGGVLQEAAMPTGRSYESDLEESIGRTLRSWGYEVVPQVGMARYRVDIGVRRRDDSSRFLIGVECDGAMYHSSRVARDRDRLRHKVLTGLGWKLHRVWSPAWYRDRHGEEHRLRLALEAAEAEPPDIPVRREEEVEEAFPAEVREVELESDQATWTAPYRIASPAGPRYMVEMHTPEAGADIRRMIFEVVEVEGPVHSELALRRVREAWGAGRAGARIRPNFAEQIERLRRERRVRLLGDFIWPPGDLEHVRVPDPDQPETERRVEHVPPQELDLALAHVASGAVAASEDQLTEKVAEVFGWHRRGPDITAALAEAVQRAVAAGNLKTQGAALQWAGELLPNRQGRRMTDKLAEPLPSPQAPRPGPPPSSPLQGPAVVPVVPSVEPAQIPPARADLAVIPSDIDRCLTAGGRQRLLDEVEHADERLQSARHQGDSMVLQRATAEADRLRRLADEARVLPSPNDKGKVCIGSLVRFREADGPEETWQLVPPLEADADESRISVLTPVGQALLGKSVGEVIEVEAPSSSYLVEITAIELP